jgi:hypothetical protein
MHLTQRRYRPRTIPASQGLSTTQGPLHRWASLRHSASLLPGCDEPFEEEGERGEHNPGKQGVVDPGHYRQLKFDIGGRSSLYVEIDVPRHEDNEGQERQAEPE